VTAPLYESSILAAYGAERERHGRRIRAYKAPCQLISDGFYIANDTEADARLRTCVRVRGSSAIRQCV
jgi:hypothetical protein